MRSMKKEHSVYAMRRSAMTHGLKKNIGEACTFINERRRNNNKTHLSNLKKTRRRLRVVADLGKKIKKRPKRKTERKPSSSSCRTIFLEDCKYEKKTNDSFGKDI